MMFITSGCLNAFGYLNSNSIFILKINLINLINCEICKHRIRFIIWLNFEVIQKWEDVNNCIEV